MTDALSRATPLEPQQWRRMISEAEEKKILVLDVRNDYEWDAGHFVGASRPNEEVFNETPVGDVPESLKDLPRDAPVMMYCTGGIRCDVYSSFLKKKGFNNLYTLEGGIQNYLRTEGPDHWRGSLYVFDGRMAIPGDLRGFDPEGNVGSSPPPAPLPAAIPCQVCGSPDASLPHMNCANIDCNELFVACEPCKTKNSGCCCDECTRAPRLLRSAKTEGGHW